MAMRVDFKIICQILEYGVGFLKTTVRCIEQPRSITIAFCTAKTSMYHISYMFHG